MQPTVLFSKKLDKDKFLVLLRNESLKDTSILIGTVLAQLCVADTVTEVPSSKPCTSGQVNPGLTLVTHRFQMNGKVD